MNSEPTPSRSSTLADDAQAETTAPVAEHPTQDGHALDRRDVVRIVLVAVAAAAVWFRIFEPFPRFSVIGALALAVGAWPIYKEAVESVVAKRMTMELSMSIAIVAAAAISEFFTALIITLFVLVAEILEGMTVSRGRRAIRDLLDVLPRTVSIRRDSSVREVDAADLRIGDAVLVSPGAALPVDGLVLAGSSFVDQSRITGESMPAEKSPGSAVFAGSINQSGVLEVRADRIGRDTSFGRIVEAVERAEHSRAPVQRLADRLAGYLVYFALASAALTFALTRNPRSTISVVIVAGACGIAAGTPLAILGAIGRAARLGAIIKGGLFLELLGKMNTLVLDKTGTVTLGEPQVRTLEIAPGETREDFLRLAASAELRSEHPLGKAIVARARSEGLPLLEPTSFAYEPGKGVTARVDGATILVGNDALLRGAGALNSREARSLPTSDVLVAKDGRLLGSLTVADATRPEAKRAVAALREMGIRVLLFTGDNELTARTVAREVGIDEVEAELLPEQKLARVKELAASGLTVGMVGDGVNDAPALMAADVGIAMGSGTDVAQESANVVLLGNDLEKFVETLRVARWTRRIIWQNFVGTLAVDALGIGLAGVGVLNPLLAAFVHVASELAFILNSNRLLPRGGRGERTKATAVSRARTLAHSG